MLLSGLSLAAAAISFVLCGFVLAMNAASSLNRIVAVGLLAYALWALGASFVYTAPDSVAFWWALRWSLLAYLTYHPVGMAITVVLAGVRGWKVWVLVLPATLFSLFEAYQLLTGSWLFTGYHTTVWGNVGELNHDSFWPVLDSLSNNLTQLLGLGVLVWAWKKNASSRYRSILLQLVVVSFLIFVAGTFCILVVWLQWGYPEPTVLLGVFYALNYVVLIRRYDLLRRDTSASQQFPQLQESLAWADPQGVLRQASAGLLTLLEKDQDDLSGRLIFEVLSGWSDLQAAWANLARTRQPQTELSGHIGNGTFLLSLTPSFNRFGELSSVLVALGPKSSLDAAARLYRLSARERDTAEHLLQGLGTMELAVAMFISPATVRNHLHNLFQKTGTSSRAELVRILLR